MFNFFERWVNENYFEFNRRRHKQKSNSEKDTSLTTLYYTNTFHNFEHYAVKWRILGTIADERISNKMADL